MLCPIEVLVAIYFATSSSFSSFLYIPSSHRMSGRSQSYRGIVVMDWFSWLSRTGLEPSSVYEYGLIFTHNELEEEDIIYFNHEFLLSMGISIAKHRLEILKLAKKERGRRPRAFVRLMAAIKRTKKSLTKHIRAWIHREESSALVVVPRSSKNTHGSRWRASMLKRNKRAVIAKEERMLLTNGSPMMLPGPPRIGNLSSPMFYDVQKERKTEREYDRGYWSATLEEIRWDTMFQDLKPT